MVDGAEAVNIEVRVREVAQLFNSLDPSPFHERDLDADAEEFIVGWAREHRREAPFRIVVYLPAEQVHIAAERGLETAFSNYFLYRASVLDRQLRDLFRTGRRHLAIGVPLLAICLIGSQVIGTRFGSAGFGKVIGESLLILGWVANWKPLEVFLYDWWPISRDRQLYRRLADAAVEVRER